MIDRRRINKRYEYLRTCSECGDKSWISYKPKHGVLCQRCSGKKLGKNISKNNIKKEDDIASIVGSLLDSYLML